MEDDVGGDKRAYRFGGSVRCVGVQPSEAILGVTGLGLLLFLVGLSLGVVVSLIYVYARL